MRVPWGLLPDVVTLGRLTWRVDLVRALYRQGSKLELAPRRALLGADIVSQVLHLVWIHREVTDLDGHALLEVLAEAGQVVALFADRVGLACGVLADRHIVAGESLPCLVRVKVHLESHRVVSVDVATRTIGEVSLVLDVHDEVAIRVTLREVASLSRRLACPRRRSEPEGVAFEEGELGAERALGRQPTSIAPEVRITVIQRAVRVDCRHGEERHLSDARTRMVELGVELELNRATEQVLLKVGLRTSLLRVLHIERDVTLLAREHPDAVAASRRPVALLRLAVLGPTSHRNDLLPAVGDVAPVGPLLPVLVIGVRRHCVAICSPRFRIAVEVLTGGYDSRTH